MQTKIETTVLDFLQEAGEIALNYQENIDDSKSYFKNDKVYSIVTEADEEISNLFAKNLKEKITNISYTIIDEEKLKNLGEDKFKTIDESEYLFIIDPIDGTLSYSLGMPLFGISVGIMKNKKPYMGFIYCPYMKEIIYHDGKETFWIKNAFTDKETKEVLVRNDNAKVIFDSRFSRQFSNKEFLKIKHDVFMNLYSAVVHFLYIATNKAKGYYFTLSLWDIAGAWPIIESLGYGLYNTQTKEPLKELSPEFFDNEFYLKDSYVACTKENLEYLSSLIRE